MDEDIEDANIGFEKEKKKEEKKYEIFTKKLQYFYDEERRNLGIAFTLIALILVFVNISLWGSNIVVFFVCAFLLLLAGLFLFTSTTVKEKEIDPLAMTYKVIRWFNITCGCIEAKLENKIFTLSYDPYDNMLFFIVEGTHGSEYYFLCKCRDDNSFIILEYGNTAYSSEILHTISKREIGISEKIFRYKNHKVLLEELKEKKEELKQEQNA